MNALLDLARTSIAAHLAGGGDDVTYEDDDERLPSQGVFVTLFSPGHQLRGCIGRMQPVFGDLRDEVKSCAIAAATRDPRFEPVSAEELDALNLEISLLGPEEPVDDRDTLDPHRFGVVVRHGPRTGVLLPNVDGVTSAEQQVGIALQKGGIAPDAPYALTRFEVTKLQDAGGAA